MPGRIESEQVILSQVEHTRSEWKHDEIHIFTGRMDGKRIGSLAALKNPDNTVTVLQISIRDGYEKNHTSIRLLLEAERWAQENRVCKMVINYESIQVGESYEESLANLQWLKYQLSDQECVVEKIFDDNWPKKR